MSIHNAHCIPIDVSMTSHLHYKIKQRGFVYMFCAEIEIKMALMPVQLIKFYIIKNLILIFCKD